MNVNLKFEVGAEFTCRVIASDGMTERYSTGTFKNLVLDSGLTQMGIGKWFDRVLVGTGSSTPVASQTGLDNYRADTSNKLHGFSTVTRVLGDNPHMRTRQVYRFAQGAASGNLTEIAIGWSSTNTWNRALIKDALGEPTVVTVASDEYLEVTVDVFVYYPQPVVSTINYVDRYGATISTHTVTVQPLLISDGTHLQNYERIALGQELYSGTFRGYMYSGAMRDIGTPPLGNITGQYTVGYPAITTPLKADNTIVFGIDAANGVHSTLVIPIRGFAADHRYSQFQIGIDPPITKTNTQQVSYSVSLTWGRYTGGV